MRVKRGAVSRRRHKKIGKLAKGFRGRRKSCYKLSKDAVHKSLQYAYRDRRTRKRDFRRLWIQRINAGARAVGLTYSQFMFGLSKAGIELDRKSLADIAVSNPHEFGVLVEQAKAQL